MILVTTLLPTNWQNLCDPASARSVGTPKKKDGTPISLRYLPYPRPSCGLGLPVTPPVPRESFPGRAAKTVGQKITRKAENGRSCGCHQSHGPARCLFPWVAGGSLMHMVEDSCRDGQTVLSRRLCPWHCTRPPNVGTAGGSSGLVRERGLSHVWFPEKSKKRLQS